MLHYIVDRRTRVAVDTATSLIDALAKLTRMNDHARQWQGITQAYVLAHPVPLACERCAFDATPCARGLT